MAAASPVPRPEGTTPTPIRRPDRPSGPGPAPRRPEGPRPEPPGDDVPAEPPAAARFLRLDSAELALSVVQELFADDPLTAVLMLVEDRTAQHGIVLPVRGPIVEHQILDRLTNIAVAASGDGVRRRLILASRRHGSVDDVPFAEEDLLCWRMLHATTTGTDLTLVEWFVVLDDGAFAIGELAGAPSAWG